MSDIMSGNKLSVTERAEFDAYIANRFEAAGELPKGSMDFLELWDNIILYAGLFGAAKAINMKVCPKCPVEFRSPESIEIKMYDSFAGRIPIIYVRDPDDFEHLVTNVAYRGVRPEGLEKTGASFISGKTTRFIILSAKPYSNVPASELGLDTNIDWSEKSLMLRREHECTHYFTKQTYGITNNILHDEIMADFIGIYEVFGFYRSDWFLRFMGIIEGSGDRLKFYTESLSPMVSEAVTELLKEAAYRLEEWSETEGFKALSKEDRIKTMCKKGLAGMIR